MRFLICALLLAVVFWNPFALAADYQLDPRQGSDIVHIESSARLEFLDGETQAIVGQFEFDPSHPQAEASAVLRVDLRTLRTGIDKRDQHMRENHLHTDKYPFCYFELNSLEGMPRLLEVDSTYTGIAHGLFYIHGVKREISAQLSVMQRNEASGKGLLEVRAEFEIRLDNFGIPRPRALFLKLAEVIKVTTVFTLYPGKPATTIELPDWELKR